jgi:hypothetical protein
VCFAYPAHACVGQVLWAASNGSSYKWVQIRTQGDPPSARFHHSCDSFSGGRPCQFSWSDYAAVIPTLSGHPCSSCRPILLNSGIKRTQSMCGHAGGKKVIVFGGEGDAQDDGGEGPSPCVYVMDVDSLTWQRHITHAPVEHSPSMRTLHATTVSHSPPHNLLDM